MHAYMYVCIHVYIHINTCTRIPVKLGLIVIMCISDFEQLLAQLPFCLREFSRHLQTHVINLSPTPTLIHVVYVHLFSREFSRHLQTHVINLSPTPILIHVVYVHLFSREFSRHVIIYIHVNITHILYACVHARIHTSFQNQSLWLKNCPHRHIYSLPFPNTNSHPWTRTSRKKRKKWSNRIHYEDAVWPPTSVSSFSLRITWSFSSWRVLRSDSVNLETFANVRFYFKRQMMFLNMETFVNVRYCFMTWKRLQTSDIVS
jgi:hypothetical protein